MSMKKYIPNSLIVLKSVPQRSKLYKVKFINGIEIYTKITDEKPYFDPWTDTIVDRERTPRGFNNIFKYDYQDQDDDFIGTKFNTEHILSYELIEQLEIISNTLKFTYQTKGWFGSIHDRIDSINIPSTVREEDIDCYILKHIMKDYEDVDI